ncbi:uncharacterized protein LOC142558600 isoform X7 [Dermacentor variabilis]|uniref:uncharacterized protein LOC142558600 isoform X7 n=1 Tax=Dermacentor variabilis TaxID=34621 RepID=UPI003F5C47B6
MSLALTQQPRCLGGPDFLLDTVASVVDGVPAAMGAEEEASSVEPVASPPPPAAKSRTSHHNCFGLPYQDHNYGAPPPVTPPQSPPPSPLSPPSEGQPALNGTPPPGLLLEVGSPPPLTNGGSPADRKEECAPNEESVTRCICGFNQDDEYMICCDQCLVWQHVDCMGLDRSRIPETYLCERCCPRRVDRQRARSLQTRKKHQMARLLSRLESAPEEDPKGAEPATKSRVVRRKRQRSESSPDPPVVHKKAMKEKIERKRVKLKGMVKRAASRRLAPSAEEEEAAVGDPWRGGSGGSEGPPSYEQAPANQYSPEVQLLASSLFQAKGGQEQQLAEEELLRGGWEGTWQLDECAPPRGRQEGRHRLVTTRTVPAQQPLLEVRGKFLSASQFRLQNPVFQKRLYPCVLFYKGWADNEDGVCVDARVYGNEARFVRRSCRPSARVRHTFQEGLLRLFLVADRDLAPAEEITIPFDFDYRHCIHRVTCACGQDDCLLHRRKTSTAASPMERKQRGRRRSSSSQVEAEVKEEGDAPQEEDGTSSGPSLDDRPPPVTDASSNEHQEGSPPLASPDSGGQEPGTGDDGDLPDSGHSSRRRKMFLMQGWLHEKQHEGAGPSSGEGPPVYVRCTRDTASGGISAAHLRRHSGSAGTNCSAAGSAKKRWLRQAMFESSEDVPDEGLLLEGAELPVSPLLEDSISPPPADLVTPLKKRRLMRGSLDSVGGLSPATGEAAATLLSFQTPLLLHRYPDEEHQPQSQHGQFCRQGEPSSAGSPPLDDPPTPLDDEGSVDWEEGPSPPAALGPRLLPPLTSGQPSPLELAGRTLEGGRRPTSAPRLPEPLPGPHDEDEGTPKPAETEVRPPPSCWGPEASDSSSSSPRGGKRKVSLSEYRQRMRDTARAPAAAAVPPARMVANKSPDHKQHGSLGRPQDVPCGAPDARALDDDEAWPQRERLSQRLRREFGLLDDDSDTERGTTPSGSLWRNPSLCSNKPAIIAPARLLPPQLDHGLQKTCTYKKAWNRSHCFCAFEWDGPRMPVDDSRTGHGIKVVLSDMPDHSKAPLLTHPPVFSAALSCEVQSHPLCT